MTGREFRAWRRRLRLTQAEAGILLGKAVRTIRYYEAGPRRTGWPVPVEIELRCEAFERTRRRLGRAAIEAIDAGGKPG